jgi:hypothetical protein
MKAIIGVMAALLLNGCATSPPPDDIFNQTPEYHARLVQQQHDREAALAAAYTEATANVRAMLNNIISPANWTKNGVSDNRLDVYNCKHDVGLLEYVPDDKLVEAPTEPFRQCMVAHGYRYLGSEFKPEGRQ